jgi:hypothetical protein
MSPRRPRSQTGPPCVIRCLRFRGEASSQILRPVHRHESPVSGGVQPPIPFRREDPQTSHQKPETLPNDRTPD